MVLQRYVLASMLFLVLGVSFVLRINFPLLLTQMVYIPNTDIAPSDSSGEHFCPIAPSSKQPDTPTNSSEINDNRFKWSQELQGVIGSSYFWGNIISQIPGGILVQKYGGKSIFLITFSLSSVVLALTPLAITYGDAYGLIATRVLYGFLNGPLMPCIASFSIAWFPVGERGRVNSIIFMGINTGGFISAHLIGMAMSKFDDWSIVFYALAGVTAVVALLFAFLCYEKSQSHPFINDTEREYLRSETVEYLAVKRNDVPPTPWKDIMTSTPVIALVLSHGIFHFTIQVLNSGFPKYMNDVLHVSIEKNSIYNSVPRLANVCLSTMVGFISDLVTVKGIVSLTNARKIFVALSTITASVFALAAFYAGCDEMLVAILLSISLSGHSFDAAGTELNAYDLGPNYVSFISSLMFTVGTATSLVAPYTIGILVPNAYLSEWRIVFWLSFILCMINTAIFSVWGSSKVQAWNSTQKSSDKLLSHDTEVADVNRV